MEQSVWLRVKSKVLPVVGLFAGIATLGEFQIRNWERQQANIDANNKISQLEMAANNERSQLKMENILNEMKAIEEQRKARWW
jgi:hypothetical protein